MPKSTQKQIFDAMTGTSIDGCDPDWCCEILQNADPKDVSEIEKLLSFETESEVETRITKKSLRETLYGD